MLNHDSKSTAAPLFSPGRGANRTPGRSRYERSFFVAMASVLLVLAVLGFTPSYQAVFAGKIQVHWFAHVHSAVMTSWLLLFLVQSILAAKGQFRYHRQLGVFAAVVGVVVWITMGAAIIRALLKFPPPVDAEDWDTITLTWVLVALFPDDPTAVKPNIECRRDCEVRLKTHGLIKSGQKLIKEYRVNEDAMATAWGHVRERCGEAERFSKEFTALVPAN